MIGSYARLSTEVAEPMKQLAVRCRSCEREFPVERIGRASEAAPFRRPSFKASYTCPHCSVTHDYTSADLTPYEGDVAGEQSTTSR